MKYLESGSTSASFNLAFEQFVFDRMPSDEDYFMLWQNKRAVIVGKHQNTAEEVDQIYAEHNGIEVIRRLSGGGAVFHDLGNFNYTFIYDASEENKLDLAMYCMPLVRVLAQLGIEAQISGRNDVMVNGCKISGSAQYIKRGRVLHHGTILFDSNLDVLGNVLRPPTDKFETKGFKSVRSRVANIRTLLPKDIDAASFREVLKKNLVYDQGFDHYSLTKHDIHTIKAIEKDRYATWEWNYGFSPEYTVRKEQRFEGVGKIQLFLGVKDGLINAIETRGDYFGDEDPTDFYAALHGLSLRNKEDIVKALSAVDVGRYYHGLSAEGFAGLILQ